MGHNPNNSPALATQRDRTADHLRIAAEAAPPQAVAQDHNRWAAQFVLLGREGASERRRDAQHLKQTSGNRTGIKAFSLTISYQVGGIEGIAGDLFKRFRLIAPFQKI